jgi:serine/threonine protein kinase
MISPYMANGSSNVYLESHPEANAISLLAGAANGLCYLHSCWPSITHGDVRGANILVSARGDALLADHGLGKIIEQHPNTQLPPAVLNSLNATINVAGIRWAAPEIVCREEDIRKNASSPASREERSTFWRDDSSGHVPGEDALIEVVTPMSDVWSFGMTIYEVSPDCFKGFIRTKLLPGSS